MGIRNVNAAFVYWSHLPDRPFRLLIRMCTIANDDTRRYYGGQEMLAEGLGLTFPPLPRADDETSEDEAAQIRKDRDRAFRCVRRAMQTLTDSGVVVVDEPARSGRRAQYSVHPFNAPEPVTERPTQAVSDRPTEAVTKRSPVGQKLTGSVGHSATPQPLRNHSQPEPHQENSPPLPTQVSARDGSEAMTEIEARRVIRNGTDDNGHALRKRAPLGITGADLTIWCAQQILNSQEAS